MKKKVTDHEDKHEDETYANHNGKWDEVDIDIWEGIIVQYYGETVTHPRYVP